MLATGGMMAIAMIGSAMSGLMATGESAAAQDDDRADAPPSDNGSSDGAEPFAIGALGSMLFEPVHAISGHAPGAPPDIAADVVTKEMAEDTASGSGALNADGDYALKGGSLTVALSGAGHNLGPANAFDVTDYTEISGGAKIHVVSEFRSGIDRLILDFDGPQEDAPRISLDIQTSPGDTLIRANGIPVTLLKSLDRAEPEDVEVHMSESYTRIADLADDGFGPQQSAADKGFFGWTEGHGLQVANASHGTPASEDAPSAPGEAVDLWIADAQTEAENATLADRSDMAPADQPNGSTALHGSSDAQDQHASDAGGDMGALNSDAPGSPDMELPDDNYDSVETVEVAEHVSGFNPAFDVIEILFDPELTPDPEVTVEDFLDGTGANILFDGQVVLSLTGGQGLDPAMVELKEIKAAPAPQPA